MPVCVHAEVDALTARVDDSAAQRFARMWRATKGQPTAEQIQAQYLDAGGRGIEVFTPGRIRNAQYLASVIRKNPDLFRNAVERCLPWVEATNAQLRATYLGLRGLVPARKLPEIAVVVGADNSGGTAAPGIQVIGLEVICRLAPTRAEFQVWMQQFFAHETVHTFQPDTDPEDAENPLLAAALLEGVPDYIAKVVTGRVPNPSRDEWARTREAWIWKEFQTDAAKIQQASTAKDGGKSVAQTVFRRWTGNAGSAPKGWPDELGYWVGMRIAEAYVAAAADPHAAIDHLIEAKDPAAILEASGYHGTLAEARSGKKAGRYGSPTGQSHAARHYLW